MKKIPASCLNIDHRVKFNLKLGIYQNIIAFLKDNNILFFSEMKLDFTQIPLELHGFGNSKNLIEYLANNNLDNILILNFLNYYLNSILKIEYTYKDDILFYFNLNNEWQNMNLYTIILPVTTTTTTNATTTTTTTNATTTTTNATTTTTTTTTALGLNLEFDSISNVPLSDPSDVNQWNTFFDLPTNGTPFTNVAISENTVTLNGGSNITLKYNLFAGSQHLLSVIDSNSSIVHIGTQSFVGTATITFDMPGVITIDNMGFGYCNATTFNLPNVETVGYQSFGGCMATTLSLPTAVTISNYAFNGSYSTTIDLPYAETIGDYAFNGCNVLTTINLPNVKTIGEQSFANCASITSINFPYAESIGVFAFAQCSSISTFYLPNVTIINNYAFQHCTSAITFNLNNAIIIGEGIFNGCSSITSFYLPNAITIGHAAFVSCIISTTFNLPNATTIGSQAFANCLSATTFNLSSCTNLGTTTGLDYVFGSISENTINLTIPAELMTCNNGNPDGDIIDLQSNNDVNIITIQPSLNLTFDDISNTPVVDPSNVNQWNTFFDLPTNGNPFTSLNISGNTVNLIGGSNITLKYLSFASSEKNSNLLKIEDFANCISNCNDSAFGNAYGGDGCYNLTVVNLPECTTIGDYVFYDCSSLITVNLPNVTSIGRTDFYNCTLITEFNLPNVTSIGDAAFYNCSSVEIFNLPKVLVIGQQTFAFCSSVTSFNLPSCTNLGNTIGLDYVFGSITGNTINLTVPAALTTCNEGSPDGDIQYLENNNSVYIITPTTTTTTTAEPTTTTTTTILVGLNLTFDNISNAPVVDPSDVSQWNTLFDLPTNGTSFTSLNVSGNTVNLYGGSGITLKNNLFANSTSLISIIDNNCISIIGNNTFISCTSATLFRLPNVTILGVNAFANCINVTTFDLSSVITISSYAFNGCTSITSFYLPNALTIGDGVFQDCSLVESFNLDGVTTIATWAFGNCISTTSLNLSNVLTIGGYAFYGCTVVTTFDLPNVTTIGSGSFQNCTSVTTFNLPICTILGETTGNDNVFFNISSNTIDLTIPDSLMICNGGQPDGDIQDLQSNNTVNVTVIVQPTIALTFDDISNTTILNSPGGVVDPSDVSQWNTFFDLPSYGTPFTSVSVSGNTVNLIGGSGITLKYNLFSNNYNLISFIDTNCIIGIGDGVFINCLLSTEFIFPNAIIIGTDAFLGCSRILSFDFPNVTTVGAETFYDCRNVTSFNIPNITSILKSTFQGCESVKTFNFPNVTTIGDQAFYNCLSATTFNFPSATTIGNVAFYGCASATTFNFPNVTAIGSQAFIACTSATSFDLPNVTTIGNQAFFLCSSVTSFGLPNVTTIGNNVFNSCTSTTSFNLPKATIIGDYAFNICSSATSFDLPNAWQIGNSAFYYCLSATTFNLPSCTNLGTTTGNDDIFTSIAGNTIDLTIPDFLMTCNNGQPDGDIQYLQTNNTVNIIIVSLNLTFDNIINAPVVDSSDVSQWNTFFDLSTNGNPFTSVNISGNTVSLYGGNNIHMKDYLFNSTQTLISVIDIGSVVSIGSNAFYSCHSATTFDFPIVTTIGNYAFYNCPNVATFDFPYATIIGNQTFNSCTSTLTFDFPNVTTIGSYAFAYCPLVETFNFPNAITIGDGAFANCLSATTFNLSSCTNLGTTTGNDNVFAAIVGNTINFTVSSILWICNSGDPDADIQYLVANNTVIS